MTRIRYKNNLGTLTSPVIESPKGHLVAFINPDGTFDIHADGGSIHKSNETIPVHKAKKLVKSALKALGVVFTEEVRPRVNSYEEYKNEVLSDLEHDQ